MEEQEQAKGVSWGMGDDAEEFPDMEQVRTLTEHFNPGIWIRIPAVTHGYIINFEREEPVISSFKNRQSHLLS